MGHNLLADGLNYLQYGHSLDVVQEMRLLEFFEGRVPKRIVFQHLKNGRTSFRGGIENLWDIVASYRKNSDEAIDMTSFKFDCERSLEWRNIFRGLGARGFAFMVHELAARAFGFIRKDLTVISLMSSPSLYYPRAIG